jgi:hypothetical protein
MRFGGANQTALWHAFAKTGLGVDAVAAPGGDDGQPTPSFASPNESNASITFKVTAPNEGNAGEPREDLRRPVRGSRDAVCNSGSNGLTGAVKFVPGRDFVAQAPGYAVPVHDVTADR